MVAPLDSLFARIPLREGLTRPISVTLSYAQSLDGSIATADRRQIILSGPASMELTHRLRAAHDAILVGIGTVLSDNPRLTVREAEGDHPQPVVLDTHLRMPMDCALFEHPKPVLLAASNLANAERGRELEEAGARVLSLPTDQQGWIALPTLLDRLSQLGVRSVMVEGGAQVISSFIRARLVDGMVLTTAPRLLGGLHAISGLTLDDFTELPALCDPQWAEVGEDWVVWGEVRWPAG